MGFWSKEYVPIFFILIFFQSKYFLSGHNSKKQLHIFLSEAVVDIFSKAAARSLKNIELFLEAATHKKIAAHFLSEVVAHFLSWFLHKINTLCVEDFT